MGESLKIDAPRAETTSPAKEQSGADTLDKQAVDDFQKAMKQPQDGEHKGEHFELASQLMPMSVGELFKNHTSFLGPAAPAENSAPNFALAEKLVSRILVSQDSARGQEVRLQLGTEILPDTEIRLIKGRDGMLQVMLLSDNPSSFQTLVAAQGTLKEQLEKFETNVRIDVSMHTQEENNDSRRRSRGYMPETDEYS